MHQRARLAQGGAGQLLRVGRVAACGVVVHAGQPARELRLQRDGLEVMALDVVELAGEAQPLTQDRQLRRRAPGLLQTQRHVPDPDRRDDDPRARGDHHGADDRQPGGLPGALVGVGPPRPRPRRTSRRRPRSPAGARAGRCRWPRRWPPCRTGAPRPARRRSTTRTHPRGRARQRRRRRRGRRPACGDPARPCPRAPAATARSRPPRARPRPRASRPGRARARPARRPGAAPGARPSRPTTIPCTDAAGRAEPRRRRCLPPVPAPGNHCSPAVMTGARDPMTAGHYRTGEPSATVKACDDTSTRSTARHSDASS